MANPYLSGRIPPELMEKVEQRVKDTGESKTDIIINAVSAYLGLSVEPRKNQNLEIWDAIAVINERLSKLENLTTQVEKSPELLLSDNLQGDNNSSAIEETKKDEPVITIVKQPDNSEKNQDTYDNDMKTPDNKVNNEEPDYPLGTIGPMAETRIANFMDVSRNKLYAARTEAEKQMESVNPIEMKSKGKWYIFKYLGKAGEGNKNVSNWVAIPKQ